MLFCACTSFGTCTTTTCTCRSDNQAYSTAQKPQGCWLYTGPGRMATPVSARTPRDETYVPMSFKSQHTGSIAWDKDMEESGNTEGHIASASQDGLNAKELARRSRLLSKSTTPVSQMTPADQRALEERAVLAETESHVNTLRAELNSLCFKAEEKQQHLERLAEQEAALRKQPEMADVSAKGSPRTKQAVGNQRSPEGGSGASAKPDCAAGTVAAGGSTMTTSQQFGSNHPTVALEHSRMGAEAKLMAIEPEMNEAEGYGETLTMMLFRLRQQHALLLADIAERRDRSNELTRESHEIKLIAGEARGAAGVAKLATREAMKALNKNTATYKIKLAERHKEIELQEKRAMKQERIQAATRDTRATGGERRLSKQDEELPTEQQQRLQRVLVATRMSSLVLLAQRDDNVEQVSRYEAAFKKMARAAGSNDAEVVIAKFIARNETRAGLLEERGQVMKRRADLDAEMQRHSAKLQEMQYSMVHPAHTESALRRLDPKLTKAAGRLELLITQCARMRDLQLAAGTGCAALLARLASAVPILGVAPEESILGGADSSKEQSHRDGMAMPDEGEVPSIAPVDETPAIDVAFEEKILGLFRTCEQRLERLLGLATGNKLSAGAELDGTPLARRGSTAAEATSLPDGERRGGNSVPNPAARRRGSSTVREAVTAPPSLKESEESGLFDNLAVGKSGYNIRVGPSASEPTKASDTPGMTPPSTSRSGSARTRAFLGNGLTSGTLHQTLAPSGIEEDDPDDESERVGYFGEERRRVKVGERPASARRADDDFQPHPPPQLGVTSSERPGALSAQGPRGRRVAKGAPPSRQARPMSSRN